MPTTRAEQLSALIDETRRLFHRLANAAEHADVGLKASQRAVLEALSRAGPRTVPDIARQKDVSRQHIQTIANSLIDEGLVESAHNPAHRRSPLLRLTATGEARFREVRVREAAIIDRLAQRFRRADLETTVRTLRTASELFGALDPGLESEK